MTLRTAVLFLACALVMVVAGLVGAVAAYFARRDHATYPAALARGAAGASTTVTLAAALVAALAALAD